MSATKPNLKDAKLTKDELELAIQIYNNLNSGVVASKKNYQYIVISTLKKTIEKKILGKKLLTPAGEKVAKSIADKIGKVVK